MVSSVGRGEGRQRHRERADLCTIGVVCFGVTSEGGSTRMRGGIPAITLPAGESVDEGRGAPEQETERADARRVFGVDRLSRFELHRRHVDRLWM